MGEEKTLQTWSKRTMLDVNTIQGIAGVQKPAQGSRGSRPSDRPEVPTAQDSVAVSSDAERAAEVQRVLALAEKEGEPEVRTEAVERARASLKEGIQEVNAVLEAVA